MLVSVWKNALQPAYKQAKKVSVWLWKLTVFSNLNSVYKLMFVLITAWDPRAGWQA